MCMWTLFITLRLNSGDLFMTVDVFMVIEVIRGEFQV